MSKRTTVLIGTCRRICRAADQKIVIAIDRDSAKQDLKCVAAQLVVALLRVELGVKHATTVVLTVLSDPPLHYRLDKENLAFSQWRKSDKCRSHTKQGWKALELELEANKHAKLVAERVSR
jgi:hypothetical protein